MNEGPEVTTTVLLPNFTDLTQEVQDQNEIKEGIIQTVWLTDINEDATCQIKLEVPELEDNTGYNYVTVKQETLHEEFATKTAIRGHLKDQPGKKITKSKSFSQRNNPGKLKKMYAGKKKFKCSICGFTSVWKQSLVQHAKKHSGEKSLFKCDACSFASAWKESLVRHMQAHTGVKRLKCTICYASIQKCYFEQHMEIHKRKKMCT